MPSSRMIVVAGFILGVAGCATTAPPARTQVAGARCDALAGADGQAERLVSPANVERVEPAWHVQRHVSPMRTHIEGAELWIPAEAGMSSAYLERVLSCHASSARAGVVASAQPNDPLQVAGVDRVKVDEHGQRYRITITSSDRHAGEAIWQRARALHDQRSYIQVEQLSSAPGTRSSL